MNILLSTLANAEVVTHAMLASGTTARFMCLTGEAPPVSILPLQIDCFRDEATHQQAVVDAITASKEKTIYFSTAASDPELRYDIAMRGIVEQAGGSFIGQSKHAALSSCNKLISRDFAKQAGFIVPQGFTTYLEIPQNNRTYVAKKIAGCAGIGQAIFRTNDRTEKEVPTFGGDYYFEEFIHGIEISASVFANSQRFWMAPIAVKGWTGEANLHATEKIRAIYPLRFQALEAYLQPLCKRLAIALQSNGWLDIDFIVTANAIYFLEVNARFSCLTRLNFLATGLNPYSAVLSPNWTMHEWMRHAMELPLLRAEDLHVSSAEALYINGIATSMRSHIQGKCVFAAADKDTLYAKCKRLAPEYLHNAVEQAESAALTLDDFASQLI